jgi:hypothetical protein
LSDDDKIKILTLRKSGLTYPKIAEQFNVSQQRIALICKQYEIEMESILVGQCNCPCHTNKGMIHSMACCNPKRIEQPKLDSSGCLILTKKI